ncbi:Aste57867_23502 [Aphanomyces stellatus]|uniref:Aste57867_23502 protein n=1 Tax=Aphanomyces stellatus TaxID=120398 RepID=A0A485LN22_9STRA|nr:hypothetical protein As57867_023431 [Aphanomyces stellatus]VFU00147.1 Aste57867_23502 [Aphanomyces stellatus]
MTLSPPLTTDTLCEISSPIADKKIDDGGSTVLHAPLPHFRLIKTHYPHFYHKRGHENEPVYYEKPGQMNLDALKAQGVTMDDLTRSYMFMTEFLWQVVEPPPPTTTTNTGNRSLRSISVVDAAGIGFFSFNSEAIDYLRKVSAFQKQRYPGRCGYIFIVNVPSWFDMVWRVVQGLVDPGIRKKITIVSADEDLLAALTRRIPLENIPREYGGLSDGLSYEEVALRALADFNNNEPGSSNPLVAWATQEILVAPMSTT